MVTTRKADAAPAADEAHALDSLIRTAEAREAAEAPAAPAGLAVQADTLEQDLFDVLKMAQAMVQPGVYWLTPERFAQLWGDHTLRGMAGPGAEIMRRQGWTVAGLMGKWGPYLALAAAVAPPTLATVQAYKLHQLQAGAAPAPAPAEGPGNG